MYVFVIYTYIYGNEECRAAERRLPKLPLVGNVRHLGAESPRKTRRIQKKNRLKFCPKQGTLFLKMKIWSKRLVGVFTTVPSCYNYFRLFMKLASTQTRPTKKPLLGPFFEIAQNNHFVVSLNPCGKDRK